MITRPLSGQRSAFTQSAESFRRQMRCTIGGDALTWEDEVALTTSLQDACETVFRRALDPAFQTRQHARFGHGRRLDTFTPQLLSTGTDTDAAHAVAELRFKSLDPQQPFVELSLLSSNASRHWQALLASALSAFASFQPVRARVSSSASERDAARAAGLSVEPDLHCLAASLRSLRNVPVTGPRRITLRPIEEVRAAYGRYVGLYGSFESSCPQIARELYRSSLEEFSEMVAHGKSFEAFVESRWAGLVAASPGGLWGQSGWIMCEEFLSAEFRGQGLGLELQRALLERLEGERGVLWGTIHASNRPSLSTALRHGRQIVQTHYWLQLGDENTRQGEST